MHQLFWQYNYCVYITYVILNNALVEITIPVEIDSLAQIWNLKPFLEMVSSFFMKNTKMWCLFLNVCIAGFLFQSFG